MTREPSTEIDPTTPVVTDMRAQDDAAPVEPIADELRKWEETADQFAHTVSHAVEPPPTGDFVRHHGGIGRYLARKPSWFLWPEGLFIPGDADWKQYWFLPAPDRNRYSRQWVTGLPTGGLGTADAKIGHVWAYAAVGPNQPKFRTEAGIGFVFKPSATLAVYNVAPSMAVVARYRYDVQVSWVGGTVREWAGIYTAAWEINPVTGALDLVKPYGLVTVFDHTFVNLGGAPIQTVVPSWSPGSISSKIMLQGNRSYLIGIIAAVQIDNGLSDDGRPIRVPLPADSIWRIWCDLDCMIPQVSVDSAIVYIA